MGSSDYLLENLAGCRDHFAGAVFNGAFALPGDKPHYPRDRVANIKHVRLDIVLDLDAKRISGSVTHTFSPLNDGLDAHRAGCGGARQSGPCAIRQGATWRIRSRRAACASSWVQSMTGRARTTMIVEFSGIPRRGLYFIGPDDAYPNKRLEAWTQGQDEDSRHWFPCYDYPNEMATSEMHVTVREPFTAIANGELRGVEPDGSQAQRTFHWHQDVPHVTYLTSVVRG